VAERREASEGLDHVAGEAHGHEGDVATHETEGTWGKKERREEGRRMGEKEGEGRRVKRKGREEDGGKGKQVKTTT
jgi:hypothetical protein